MCGLPALLESTRVRVRLLFFLAVFSAAAMARAETIVLKNGRKIRADRVHETASRVEYEVGEDSYAIPRSLVDRIDKGGSPAEYSTSKSGPGSTADLPLATPNPDLQLATDLEARILANGHVNNDALTELERTTDAGTAAAGYFVAGRHELAHQNFDQARAYYEKALQLQPENATLLQYYAAVLTRTGHAHEAVSYAERAVRLAPGSAQAWAVLGATQYASGRNAPAVQSWKKSVSLHADAAVERMLAKAQKDASTEADFAERDTGHFTLRYEGKQTTEGFRHELLDALESQYSELVGVFGVAPRDNIVVVLYTGQAFFDVTQAPSWTTALNDGKLRIPVSGLETVPGELVRVLRHELAHSFINYLAKGRCPQWLHEGVAQVVEPRSLGSDGRRLAQFFAAQRSLPFNMLESGFLSLSPPEAALAYDESLAAAEYLKDTYGFSDVRRILERIGEGSSAEAALRSTIHSDYGQLETDVGKFLVSKYGN
jgi:tetratricopeptide (TPR) repeat protein